jgi:hypothetical protein
MGLLEEAANSTDGELEARFRGRRYSSRSGMVCFALAAARWEHFPFALAAAPWEHFSFTLALSSGSFCRLQRVRWKNDEVLRALLTIVAVGSCI